ncbi:MAG: hypothetical protein ACKVVT_10065 [Dehalococcoidia bacterium]
MRALSLGFAAILAVVTLGSVRADGEAGLVIQDGDAVTTYCVPFRGDGIDGDDLLTAAGVTFDQFGGGGGRTLCSLRDKGCPDAGSFNECFCQCTGGASCTYWAFFTQRYGASWVYSAGAFNLTRAKDGEIHGWKWGRGNLQSAPAPAPITFDQICGHPPGALAAPTETPTATPTAAAVPPSSTTAPAATTAAAATTTTTATTQPTAASPAVTVVTSTTTAEATTTATPFTPLPPGSATATVRVGDASPPAPPAGGSPNGDGGSAAAPIVFGMLALGLGAAIVAAVVWRRRHA